MEIRFSQSDTRKVFLACAKNVHPIRTTNHAFVLQGMNTRQFSRHFCLLHPQRTPQPNSLNASRVESGCLKKGRFFVAEKCFLILSVLNVFNYKVYHQGPSCKHPPINSEFASYTIKNRNFTYLLAAGSEGRPYPAAEEVSPELRVLTSKPMKALNVCLMPVYIIIENKTSKGHFPAKRLKYEKTKRILQMFSSISHLKQTHKRNKDIWETLK